MYRTKITNARPTGQSGKFLREKKQKNIFIAGLVIISVITWTAILSRLSSLNVFTIDKVVISGADDDIAPILQTAALQAMEGKYLNLFSKANSFIYSEEYIKKSVKSASERIKTVTLRRKGLKSLAISVEEKEPAALFCKNLPEWNGNTLSLDSDECYFGDAAAKIYRMAPSISGNLYNRYYISDLITGTSTSASVEGRTAMNSDLFKSLQRFYDGIKQSKIEVLGMLVNPNGEYELYITNISTSTAVVYFNNRNKLDTQLSNFVSFWTNMQSKASAKSEKLVFDSIDLRYGYNVFYRLSSQ